MSDRLSTTMRRIKSFFTLLPYLIKNIYFNFHYFPFKMAIKMPVWLYKPSFGKLEGSISIQCDKKTEGVKSGMIRLGFKKVALYPNTGIHINISGGEIVFQGPCSIGNDSYIAVGKYGKLVFGDHFYNTAGIKISCQYRITFGKNVHSGWETMYVDSDFHKLKRVDGEQISSKPYGAISVGDGCWLGFRSVVKKNCNLPNNCIVASNSVVLKTVDVQENSLLGGMPAKVISTGFYRDYDDDDIIYEIE